MNETVFPELRLFSDEMIEQFRDVIEQKATPVSEHKTESVQSKEEKDLE